MPGSEYVFCAGTTAVPLYHAHPHIPEECVLPDDPAEQARRVLDNVTSILDFLGLGWGDVVHRYEFMTDLRDAEEIHAAVREHLGSAQTPPATVVGVNRLASPGARLEMAVVAARSRVDAAADGLGAADSADASPAPDGSLLWASGARAIQTQDGAVPDASEQTRGVLSTLDEVLASHGAGWGDVAAITQLVTDLRDQSAVDAIVAERLGELPAHPPVITLDVTGLADPQARIEIEVVAQLPAPAGGRPGSGAALEAVQPSPDRAELLPYAPATRVTGGRLHFLGGVGVESPSPLPDDIAAQTRMLFDTLDARLDALGLGWTNVANLLMFVTDIREADEIGDVMQQRYGTTWKPASTMVQLDALERRGARVHFEVIAAS